MSYLLVGQGQLVVVNKRCVSVETIQTLEIHEKDNITFEIS